MNIEWHLIEMDLIDAWESRDHFESLILKWAKYPISEGRLVNRHRPGTQAEREEFMGKVGELVSKRLLLRRKVRHPRNKTVVFYYQNAYAKKLEHERRKIFGIVALEPGGSVSFDVSQPCGPLLMDIQETVRSCGYVRNSATFSAQLSEDRKTLTVTRND